MKELIKKYPILVPIGVTSGMLSIFGLFNQVYDLLNLGLPSLVWAGLGAGVFFISFFKLLINLNSELSKATTNKSNTTLPPQTFPKGKLQKTKKIKDPFNYSSWAMAEEFEIAELSKVLAGQSVKDEVLNEAARGWFNTLDTAVETGRIPGTKKYGRVWVSGEDAKNYFESRGKKHPLFHPEERNKTQNLETPKKVNQKKKGWVFRW